MDLCHAPCPTNTNGRLRDRVQFERLKRALNEIANGHGANVEYSQCYFSVYHLVIEGRAIEVRAHVVELMKKLACARIETVYFDICRHLESVMLYCEHTYVARHELKPLILVAKELYDRPVAARWRKVRLWALWHRYYLECRVLFAHGKFGPEGSGAAACKAEFYALAG